MFPINRREFLNDVGRGMFVAGLGSGLAADLGLSVARAEEPKRLTFGELEPLVGLLQDTPAGKLLPLLVKKIADGTSLKDLVAAATFANARTFGGEDYIGFHTMMALAPAWHMSAELPQDRKALPILKVLYRNTARMQEKGGSKSEVLSSLGTVPQGNGDVLPLLDHVRRKDMTAAEEAFALKMGESSNTALNYLLEAIEDSPEVHRVVLPYRAWEMLDIVGKEHAHTLLRQSVHYCVKNENPDWGKHFNGIRKVMPELLDRYHLISRKPTRREADEVWIEKFSETLFAAKPESAAEAVAAALSEGVDPKAIAEAIALAANQLVLRDAGRPQNQTSPGKGLGSVHGDSIGVHASDSANAWRHLSLVADDRNRAACLIVSGWQVANDRLQRGGDFSNWKARPLAEQLEKVKGKDPKALLAELEDAIRQNDQAHAVAVTARCGEMGIEAKAIFDLLRKYAISEEGALHAEKYFRTTSEEFALAKPKFKWRNLLSLARITASEYGTPAAGYAEMCRLLKLG